MNAFEDFFCNCVELCAEQRIGPDDYIWDINNPGVWMEKFQAGVSPLDAVMSVFRLN